MTTVGRMVGELGFFSDIKTVGSILASESCSLVFDATTQDGIHVNCMMVTTPSSSYLVSIERLPGGTAEDYRNHISSAIKKLADVYSSVVSTMTYASCHKAVINKFKCCLTDQAPANHLTVFFIGERVGHPLN